MKLLHNATDSVQNFTTGLGTRLDKVFTTQFFFQKQDAPQLERAYRGSWLARKIVDIPVKDSVRAWRKWIGEPKDVEKIEEVERDLEIPRIVSEALIKDRLYGGSVMVLGVGKDSGESELRLNDIKKGDLNFVFPISRNNITYGKINWNPEDSSYGQPDYYELSLNEGGYRVHATRAVKVVSRPLPGLDSNDDGWGDSILDVLQESVKQAEVVAAAAAQAAQNKNNSVIRLPEFMENVVDQEYRTKLLNRLAMADSGRSIYRMMVLDSDEEWEQMTADLNSLPDLLRLFLTIASGAADIPATRLLGQSPAGMNATGESDMRNYYDSISSMQESFLRPCLRKLDEVLVRSALGSYPDDLEYEWNSLWQMRDDERAKVDLDRARAFQIDVSSGVIPDDVLMDARVAQLDRDEVYPGLKEMMEEWKESEPELPEDNPDDPRNPDNPDDPNAPNDPRNPNNPNNPAPAPNK